MKTNVGKWKVRAGGWLLAVACAALAGSGCTGGTERMEKHVYNGKYTGAYNNRIAFPIGAIGTGMFCLEGTGYISHMSVWHRPEVFHEPGMFAALHVAGAENGSKVLEGPIPDWRKFGMPGSGLGGPAGATYGLPRFDRAGFEARFPFGKVSLDDSDLPVSVTITGWNPFIPGDADNSSLPVGMLEYTLENTGNRPVESVFSYHSRNFMNWGKGLERVRPFPGGFVLSQQATESEPYLRGDFAVFTDEPGVTVDHCWFRGGWFDGITMAWNAVKAGKCVDTPLVETAAAGASLYVPVSLAPGAKKTVRIYMAWYVPESNLRAGGDPADGTDNNVPAGRLAREAAQKKTYSPWYSGRFASVEEVAAYLKTNYADLRARTEQFTEAFYRMSLPPEVVEAVAANLTILKSTTVMRQADGRMWNWEGSGDGWGSCFGSCTHVWNYAQALSHLFPGLEQSLRHTEFEESQDKRGHQTFRSALPIRPVEHGFHAAADGQLGGIMKVYREWRVSGDDAFLEDMYPKVKASLDYCIATWDPRRIGAIEEPHHNTYDIEFWGPDGMHASFYLGALQAFIRMSDYLHRDATEYKALAEKGKQFTESELYDGEYFVQQIRWKDLKAGDPTRSEHILRDYSPEARQVLEKEGPKYQYGSGCLSDGVLGSWIARMCGLDESLDAAKVKSHLEAVYRYNFRTDLSDHANPQRPTFALGREAGLLLCSWPKGGELSLPFVYSNEVWTGIEYQVASHLMLTGNVKEGLAMVRACRDRYDGRVRNPFDEYECGHWYARAMASYGLMQGLTGMRYDAVEKTLYIDSKIGDFTGFLSTATGFGNVGLRDGKPFVKLAAGTIDVQRVNVSGRISDFAAAE